MPPSEIGKIAATAKVKKLILSHRMLRTLGRVGNSEKNSGVFTKVRWNSPMISTVSL
ncbi:MAG: hypothetical protein V3W04_10010 [Gammaproteobacteria bacterium]